MIRKLPLMLLASATAIPLSQAVPGPLADVSEANRAATLQPAKPAFINAMQVFPFSDGTVYQVYTAPNAVTDVELQPGEALIAIASGDTARWVIGDTTSGNGADKRSHILVKPFAPWLQTNLVITTDRRTYHLRLSSTASIALASLRWTYPQDELLAVQRTTAAAEAAKPVADGLDINRLHFNYVISGDMPAWRPLRAFDDGRQTFIELPPAVAQGEIPPLFVLGADGQAALVNYRLRDRFYVVDRIFGAAELRLGLKKQQIVRITRIVDKRRRAA